VVPKKCDPQIGPIEKKMMMSIYTFAGGIKTHVQKIPTSKSDALEDEFTVSDGHVSGCHAFSDVLDGWKWWICPGMCTMIIIGIINPRFTMTL
jgi:hypothetical protein